MSCSVSDTPYYRHTFDTHLIPLYGEHLLFRDDGAVFAKPGSSVFVLPSIIRPLMGRFAHSEHAAIAAQSMFGPAL